MGDQGRGGGNCARAAWGLTSCSSSCTCRSASWFSGLGSSWLSSSHRRRLFACRWQDLPEGDTCCQPVQALGFASR